MSNKITKNSKIFLAGHNGLVGSSIYRKLKDYGYKNIIVKSKKQLDLRNQNKVNLFFSKNKFHAVINAAAMVGGIHANDRYKAEFIFNNLSIQSNIIHSSYVNNVKHMIFLGSSCVYPRNCKQPIKEEYLLNGKLEKTNEPYAVAKIAGIKMCESYNFQYNTNYKCLMPCNSYGPNDNYDLITSHFYPALIKKIELAKEKNNNKIIVWGNGKSKREIIYVDDVADACIFFLNKKTKESLINIGSGVEKTILQYAKFLIKKINPNTKIIYDKKKPNGTPRKILDTSLAKKYGWKPKVSLEEGFNAVYRSYLKEK
jgi:GDP-L-fucose synthase